MTAARYLTITLTGEPPVRILVGDWPIIAAARESTDKMDYRIKVRRAADGRLIVAGVANPPRGNQIRAGALVSTIAAPPPDDLIAAAIRRVVAAIGAAPTLADRTLAAMPARTL